MQDTIMFTNNYKTLKETYGKLYKESLNLTKSNFNSLKLKESENIELVQEFSKAQAKLRIGN